MKTILVLLFLILLSGCTTVIFSAANAPSLTFDGVEHTDIQYGQLPRQTLDIYLPEKVSSQTPVFVFFHGGRWTFGNKDQYAFIGIEMAKRGIVTVVPNTRLYPDVKFPTFVEDAALAVAWVQNNIVQYGASTKLVLSGHSSGAHIAGLLSVNPVYLQQVNADPKNIVGFAGISGPYDFVPESEDLVDMFGPESQFSEMQLTTFIDGSEPPMLLLHAKNDETVHIRNFNRLVDAVKSNGGSIDDVLYKSGGHAGLVAAFSWANPADVDAVDRIEVFVKKPREISKNAP